MNWKELEQRAHVPYSKVPKACVIESSSGSFYPGVRIENVSFPLTMPAIQVACCLCLADGETPKSVHISNAYTLEQFDFWVNEFNLSVVESPKIEAIIFESPTLSVNSSEVKPTLVALLDKAITTNSDFPVSALLFCKEGVVPGVNIEVSDWTKGLCGERVAISKAISYGLTDFDSMSLHTLKGEFSSPCGACRQVIHEHMPDNEINFYHADGTLSTHYTSDLLPFSFTSKSLAK